MTSASIPSITTRHQAVWREERNLRSLLSQGRSWCVLCHLSFDAFRTRRRVIIISIGTRACLQGYRANGSQICAVRTRPPERQVNTQSTATYVIHDEEHTWRRHSPGSESRDSTHAVVFAPPAENTPADHRAAVGAGPSKRAISPPQHKQGPTALSVHDRLYLTDVASSRVDPHRHGNDRPF